jgi:O-antigen ligase
MPGNIISGKYVVVSAMLLTAMAVVYSGLLVPGIGILLFLLVIKAQPARHILLLIAYTLVALSGDMGSDIRNVLNVAALLFLLYYFIKENGTVITSYPVLTKPVWIFISGIILSMIFSSLFSASIITGFIETGRQGMFFVIWYILYSAISGEKDLFNYIGIIIASGTTLGIIILYQLFTSGTSVIALIAEGMLHESGILNNPAAAGGVFAVAIPLTAALISSFYNNKKIRLILALLLIIQASGLLLTNSRAAVIASIVSSLVLLFILKRKLFYRSLISVTAAVSAAILVSPFLLEMIQLYFRAGRILENTRYLLWDMSAGIIADNPIWGTGPGQFKSQMYSHMPVMLGTWNAEQIKWVYESSGLGESHNFYLFRTAELGILGLASAVCLPVIFTFYSLKTMKAYKGNKKLYSLSAGIFSMGVGLFARSFLEATGLLSHGWISRDLPFWLCFAVIIYLYKNSQQLLNLKNENITAG